MQPLEKGFSKYTVAVRVRPPQTQSTPVSFSIPTFKTITQHRPSSLITYSFDHVFDQTKTNQDIYNCLEEFVRRGFNKNIHSTILAYGQTGSGKTHTLFGHENNGLIHYISRYIFDSEQKYKITCSAIQIYNQKAMDLTTNNEIKLLDDSKGNMIVEGLELKQVKTIKQFQLFLKTMNKNKVFGSSYIHNESSRSHVLMTFRINGNHLNIVDLCGNQVLTYNFNQKQRAQTNNINLSLFTLNSVLAQICDKKNKYIPYRNSILTRLLKNSLSTNNTCQIYMICNINPQSQHIEMSRRTLRFGQLAIEIDQNSIQQQIVNLSEQKRQSKKIKNIIDQKLDMEENQSYKKIKWEVDYITINEEKVKIYKLNWNSEYQQTIVLLHAYGYYCDGTDWNRFVSYILQKYPSMRMLSVDFPGFGQSTGKKFTSRSEKFGQKNQPIDFIKSLFSILKLSTPKKLTLIGYDLGGAISLSCCLDPKLSKLIDNVICFHPTWTDNIQSLSPITQRVLLLWMNVETFHLVSAGQKMSKTIKNSTLYRFNIGVYKQQKCGGYYDPYSRAMSNIMCTFISQSTNTTMNIKNTNNKTQRGKVVQVIIQESISKEQQKLMKCIESVKQYFNLISKNSQSLVYESLMRTSQNTPKYTRLASNLQQFLPETLSYQYLMRFNMVKQNSNDLIKRIEQSAKYPPGRQVQIKTKLQLNMLSQDKYLKYTEKGDIAATHLAWISKEQTEQQIIQSGIIAVDVLTTQNKLQRVNTNFKELLQLNEPTQFSIVNRDYIFEDSVTCKYSSLFVKLKIHECLFFTLQLIQKLYTLNINSDEFLKTQKQIAKLVVSQINLRHLVHEGIDNTRYTGTDVGKLAYRGQGNCHHLASVASALLLPFGKLCGWDVVFRAGSCLKTGREIDQNGNPLPSWNGKPKLNVQDHTWLQVVFKPSFKSYVFDPSFDLYNYEFDRMYAPCQFHISGKPQCVYQKKKQVKIPKYILNPK